MKIIFDHRLKGFTLAEVIVTLALTSMAVMFAYSTLTYVQKLFYLNSTQNKFVQEYTNFKERMDHEALYAEFIMEEKENAFRIKRDSIIINLEVLKDVILFKKNDFCDTFHLAASNVKKEYERMPESYTMNKLLRSMRFEVEFSKQKFNFRFVKNHDASVKLKLDKEGNDQH